MLETSALSDTAAEEQEGCSFDDFILLVLNDAKVEHGYYGAIAVRQ